MATNTSVGLRSERGPILLALMLSTALVALDATIIATASATIARDLGGFEQLPWLFSTYLLAQAVGTPLSGRLADVLGRKRMMLAGVALFFLGSVLCGAAWSMGALIVGRVLQGLGAGAVMPASLTIASDIYTLEERAKTQGYLASVWAISSVVGPTLGGVFSEFVSWRWIFFVNIPLCAFAAWMLVRRYHESPREGAREPIDYLGAALLASGSTLLLLGLLEGGSAWPWDSPASVAIFAGSAGLLTGFVLRVRRARHPIVDLSILRRRVVAVPSAVSLMVGVIVLALSTYIPIYAQGVLGVGPLVAGFTLAAMMVGWPLAATNAGSVYLRIGFRLTAMIGSSLVLTGLALALLLGASTAVVAVAGVCFLVGVGMGLTAVPTLIAAQSSASFSERGAVTGTNMFARSLGSAVGVAVCGAIVNSRTTVGADGVPEGPGLMSAMHVVFILLAVCAAVLVVLATLMPTDRRQARERRAGAAADAAAPTRAA
ncbi:EmrB/QacA subfamily drug resistance transporter [Isoptericola sp. CG 20/1183]|uniref:MFS-type drug efflux transporter P55 n=2 Tax=Isoptericola halotolerans TaxID=300560 RepID=A0ABX5EBY7_9MICO|nr:MULTISPECIES: MDR family MFS transporter [Isoptericola]PRZ05032.1 EmrB/QacA subfamily drug resistance transporter [Isoptericola halotolerans]PRZ05771.1 EmrB/QacA subfamily drug resistance transporter [Isoptericola sp. CG 20/1183]